MKKKAILDLMDNTEKDDDAGFQKIISGILNGEYLTVKDLAHEFGTSLTTIKRWRDGKNAPHPVMRKLVFKYVKNTLLCMCPKKCDCQNPPPDDGYERSGVYHVSEFCPKYNRKPQPDPDCSIHK